MFYLQTELATDNHHHRELKMSQLNNIELINNKKNTTEILTKTQHNILSTIEHKVTDQEKIIQQEFNALPQDFRHCLLNDKTTIDSETQTQAVQHEFQAKDHSSDSDSALSSAPPSISPQPPPNGMDSADIWQTIRTYMQDIEKLQKECEMLQKQNENSQKELHLAKEQILTLEQNANKSTIDAELNEYKERIKMVEEQKYQLESEANELREQNELLEFRILELEETHDKWSPHSHNISNTPLSAAAATATAAATANAMSDLWSSTSEGLTKEREDPMQTLFGNMSLNIDSGITSPHSLRRGEELEDSPEELCHRLSNLLKKNPQLDERDKQCLLHLFSFLQQLESNSLRSGPESVNVNSSSEPSSLELLKTRHSDYSSCSGASSTSSNSKYTLESGNCRSPNVKSLNHHNVNARIVATVQPYNSNCVPTSNTPTDSPHKVRASWQSNSLSESGVFVESDFLGDFSERHVYTQTEFEAEERINQRLERVQSAPGSRRNCTDKQSLASEVKRLQYYKERLELLEGKVLVYESSGDIQTKHLADRLQREIQLEKELKELRDKVAFLETENSTLEEEKCEFEEAENDTRLRLQRLEVDLEILTQRNVELELSKEALSAKYKDCRSESLVLQDDLLACETQIRNLKEDKKRTKKHLEILYKSLPLLLIYKLFCSVRPLIQATKSTKMGNELSTTADIRHAAGSCPAGCTTNDQKPNFSQNRYAETNDNSCPNREVNYLKEEVKNLRRQIKELNSRHYEAMETADSHWVDLEKEYKVREDAFRAKEVCLKQKIGKLTDCLRDDARAANEKIQQLEEAEEGLKTCLMRISKELRELQEEHKCTLKELETYKEQNEQILEQQKPLAEALDTERRRSKNLADELSVVGKVQQNYEEQYKKEADDLRSQIFNMRKEYLHIEVTNGELKEEVNTLETKIEELQKLVKEYEEKERVLQDELRTKEELCQQLELKSADRQDGHSLAQELYGPSKRIRREDVKDLKTASKGLGFVLRSIERCERELPTHMQFHNVARDVKKLADTLLKADGSGSEELLSEIDQIIQSRLVDFHKRKIESEFYLTVFHPVERPSSINFSGNQ